MSPRHLPTVALPMPSAADEQWLERFRRGDRATLAECYADHLEQVKRAVGRVLRGADQENLIHEVFLRVIADGELRRSFRGGSLGAWLGTMAYHQAIDYVRRHQRHAVADRRALAGEAEVTVEAIPELSGEDDAVAEARAKLLVDQFRKNVLPAKWAAVFEARFVQRLTQRDAARVLGIPRTTLAYQELRLQALLKRFLLEESDS